MHLVVTECLASVEQSVKTEAYVGCFWMWLNSQSVNQSIYIRHKKWV